MGAVVRWAVQASGPERGGVFSDRADGARLRKVQTKGAWASRPLGSESGRDAHAPVKMRLCTYRRCDRADACDVANYLHLKAYIWKFSPR